MAAGNTLNDLKVLINGYRSDGEISGEELTDIFQTITNVIEQNDTQSLNLAFSATTVYDTPATSETSGNPSYSEFNDRFWRSKIDQNQNNPPPSDKVTTENTYWIEVSKANANPIKEWSPGLYGSGLIIIFYNDQLYKLNVGSRPYESTNINTEIGVGNWVIVSDKGKLDKTISTPDQLLIQGQDFNITNEFAPTVRAKVNLFTNFGFVFENDNGRTSQLGVQSSSIFISNRDSTSGAGIEIRVDEQGRIYFNEWLADVPAPVAKMIYQAGVMIYQDLSANFNNPGAILPRSVIESISVLKSESENFTLTEKSKLAGLESSKFLGTYLNLTALQTAHPDPGGPGFYADVDAGIGSDVERYIWDVDDAKYVLQGSGGSETAASIKAKYESNPDTNAFTDAEKAKLGNQSGINTGDETATTIKSKYEGNADTNAFTDAEKSKLAGIAVSEEKVLSGTSVNMTSEEGNILSRTVSGTENITITNPKPNAIFTILATGGTGFTVNSQAPIGDIYAPSLTNIVDVRCVRTSPALYEVINHAV